MRQAGTLCCSRCNACTYTHLSSRNKIQRNGMGLNITMRMQAVGANSGQKIQRDQKSPTATSEEPGAKTGCQEQKQGPECAPALNTTRRVGKMPKPAPQLGPWTRPYPHLIWGTSFPPFRQQASKGTCYLFLLPSASVLISSVMSDSVRSYGL